MSEANELEQNYRPLDTISVVPYVKENGFFQNDEPLLCDEIGDGNLNYVFHIRGQKSGKSIIVKQALPYAKVVGESMPLTLDRSRIESDYLKYVAQYVPNLVPEVYFTDPVLAVTIMEDLSHLKIVRQGLIEQDQYPLLAQHVGEYMAQTLFHTSDMGMNQSEKKQLFVQFCNPELCKITEDLVFTDPFFNHDTNNYPEALQSDVEQLWNDSALKLNSALLKLKFLTSGQALLHGDMHTGSMFANKEETKVIDPEFSFMGPIGFDVGSFIANLLMNLAAQEARISDEAKRTAYQEKLREAAVTVWNVFSEKFKSLWEEKHLDVYGSVPGLVDQYLRNVLYDTAGFAGCEMIRRTIGLAHVADIDGIEQDKQRLQVQRAVLRQGRLLILNHLHVHSIEDLLATIE